MPRAATPQKIQTNQSRRGGARPGAGRKRGRPDRATLPEKEGIEAQAREHAPAALKALIEIATTGASEPARVSAAMGLLGYGYGKPRQAVEHSGEGGGPLVVTVTHRIVDPAPAPHTNGTKPRPGAR